LASAFTAFQVATDIATNPDVTVVQSLTITGASWIQAAGCVGAKNETATIRDVQAYIRLLGVSDGAYIGCVVLNNVQIPLPVRGFWRGLDPTATYTLQLVIKKGSSSPVISAWDPELDCVYSA
jgi:hypothetical protein